MGQFPNTGPEVYTIKFNKDLFRQSTYFSDKSPQYQNSYNNVVDLGFQEDVNLVNEHDFKFVIPLDTCCECSDEIKVGIPYKIKDNLESRISCSDLKPVTDFVCLCFYVDIILVFLLLGIMENSLLYDKWCKRVK